MASEQKAELTIRPLYEFITEIQKIASTLIDLEYDLEDKYGLVLLVFLKRCYNHTKSILALGKSKDILLVMRSLIEGGTILSWVESEGNKDMQKERALNYLRSHITERIKQMQKSDGKKASTVLKNLAPTLHSSNLLTDDQYNSISSTSKLKNNIGFLERLTGSKNLRTLFGALDSELVYTNYAHASNFAHWNPIDARIFFNDEVNNNELSMSLSITYMSLSFVCKEITTHFGMNGLQTIEKTDADCLKMLFTHITKE